MPRLVPPGGGEVIGSSPDRRVELVSDHEAVHATWSRFAARRPGADLHVHRRHSDLFYVLGGELVLLLGTEGRSVPVPVGTLACVPPLVVHGFRAGAGELRYLNLHAPGLGFAGYLRALRDGRPAAYDQEEPPADPGEVRPPGEARIGTGELVLDRPGLREVLLADAAAIRVAELRMDGAGPGSGEHAPHPGLRSLYVLEGELEVATGSRRLRATAGAWLQVPAGVPHAVAPAAGRAARVLDVRTPGGPDRPNRPDRPDRHQDGT